MFLQITDNRYFTLGVDDILSQNLDAYDVEQYEREYPRISSTMPELFSINLKEEIENFITKAPPQFKITIEQVIELACYYYSDWETMVAVIDEFIQIEVLFEAKKNLILTSLDIDRDTLILEELMGMLSEALTNFIGIIIGMLTRAGIPAIAEYGCCCRLENIDDYGNVYFRLCNPSQVYAELEGGLYHGRQGF